MHDTSNISRGVWAGHCFDITTLARHGDEIQGAEWRDVSKEVASEAGTAAAIGGPFLEPDHPALDLRLVRHLNPVQAAPAPRQ